MDDREWLCAFGVLSVNRRWGTAALQEAIDNVLGDGRQFRQAILRAVEVARRASLS